MKVIQRINTKKGLGQKIVGLMPCPNDHKNHQIVGKKKMHRVYNIK